ncbi:MAG: hypothetical protein IJM54_04845 [Thermoguttaceae bacterium]|nr:hypothetical protein [Thermoguttaceae bacterium]
MAEMEITTVQEKLAELFKTELPDDYRRRIVFWDDPAEQFEDKWNEIRLDGVKIVKRERNESCRL